MAIFEKATVNLAPRIRWALLLVTGVFAALILRLWYLQVLKGDEFRTRSENNRIRTVFAPPPRGLILDRDGKVLVKSRPAFNIEFVSEDSPQPEETLSKLANLLGEAPTEVSARIKNQKKRRRFEPKVVVRDASRDLVAKVMARSHDLPGVVVNVVPLRQYVFGAFASHILGYIREITKEQLDHIRYSQYGYRQGDIIGQYGIEERWEPDLQGKPGVRAVIVSAAGVRRGDAYFQPEVPGRNVRLTLQYDMQNAAEEAMKDKAGAVVAMDPKTGEILTLISAPDFDPNIFTADMPPATWADLISGKEKKLNNRAVQGAYPPGSVFKIFMAVAALSEGIISDKDQINCPGWFRIGARRFRCHKKSGHGLMNFDDALIKSCDVYFYTVGQRLGVDRIHDYAAMFGLGKSTGLDLVQEHPGLVPSTAWKRTHFRRVEDQKWYPGETPSVAIGQGALLTTPLQIARALSTLVNGGKLIKPRLIDGVESKEGSWKYKELDSGSSPEIQVDRAILKRVQKALKGVVNDPGGTGGRAKLAPEFHIEVAGKTGTAQSVGAEFYAKHFEDHAWFAGYAPADKPEIVVVALIEHGGHGGTAAAPVVKAVMEAYFRKQLPVPATPTERSTK